jgi:hypothetical protein
VLISLFRLGNNVTGGVYCLRARDRTGAWRVLELCSSANTFDAVFIHWLTFLLTKNFVRFDPEPHIQTQLSLSDMLAYDHLICISSDGALPFASGLASHSPETGHRAAHSIGAV